MALGAITLNQTGPVGAGEVVGNLGNLRFTRASFAGDSSYQTGGTTITLQQLGLGNVVLFAICQPTVVGANGPVQVHFNPATLKLLCYSATGEVTANTDLSGSTIQVLALGY